MDEVVELKVNGEIGEQLRAARGWVRLLDEDGCIIGNFKPPDVPPYDPALLPPPMTAEELQRRLSQPGGLTTEEVLKKLQEL